jgi:hypothetical protein
MMFPAKMYGTYGIEVTDEVLMSAGFLSEHLSHGEQLAKNPTLGQMWVDGRWLTNVEMSHLGVYLKFRDRHAIAATQFIRSLDWMETVCMGAWEDEQKAINDNK